LGAKMLSAIRTLSHRPCKISVARYRQWLSTETDHKHSYVEEEQARTKDDEDSTHYGFETVSREEKARRVHHVFEGVASKYDLMNDLMSAGLHRLWKDSFVAGLAPFRPGARVLDVAGGTGDIAFRIANRMRRLQSDDPQCQSQVTVCDINEAMLEVGQRRCETLLDVHGRSLLSWLTADAQNLPLPDDEFDLYTIAFGIRNVVDVQRALDEAYRVLKPGGRFACLEFSHVTNPGLRWVYDKYSFEVIPPLGEVVAGDYASYKYLVESIRQFPRQQEFKSMIEQAGFRFTSYRNLTFGVVAIHTGFKM